MVELRRRARPQAGDGSTTGGMSGDGFHLPYADGNSPKSAAEAAARGFGAISGGLQSFAFQNDHNNNSSSKYKLLIRLFCVLGVLSCIASHRASNRARNIAEKMEVQQMALQNQGEDTLATLGDAREGLKNIRVFVDGLKHTQDALYHEIRMVNEMFEAESAAGVPDSPRRGSSDTLVESWMEHRQEALKFKINNLKNFIQQESREQVIERYGPGPHRAKFTIDFLKHDLRREFVIEMAPLELMPHSVHQFLEMIRLKLWDNTVFWHHDDVEHIIAGALFNYRTGEPKFHHLKALGWEGMKFAEHSDQYPHKKYTIGYSGNGPNIYINLQNNQAVHGPGSQQGDHVRLPDEGDPCFARIVEGEDVVDAMYRLSLQDKEKDTSSNGRDKTWDENELTRIVKVEML